MVLSSFYRSLYYLYITHGVIWGLGQATCYFPSFLIISQHFETRYSLAIGIAVCGASVGTLVQSPGTDWLFRRFGLAWSFQILGATYLIVIPCGLIFRPAVDGASVPLERFKYFDWTICKNRAFLVYLISLKILMLGYLVPYVHLVGPFSN